MQLAVEAAEVAETVISCCSNNVNGAFNAFRAAAELKIKRVCYASSVNAIGLAYANQPLKFDYFP